MDYHQYAKTNPTYKCERQGCKSRENYVACLRCVNTFYCSHICRNADASSHATICTITNTRDMLMVNTFINTKIKYVLSQYAIEKYKGYGAGIINVRSYNSIWDFTKDYDADMPPKTLFISYIPLDQWYGYVPTVNQNDYDKMMIVNFNIEDMNKPQLHRFPIVKTPLDLPEKKLFACGVFQILL